MKIVRTADQPWKPSLQRGRYDQRFKPLGDGRLRASLYELAPGKKSFPFHAHALTEEALYVLSGRAQVRTPEGLTPVGPGDYVAFPAGGPAHQLVNDGAEPLLYLGLSASQGFDLVEYPDTGKVGVAVGVPPTGRRMVFKADAQVDYFLDDKDAG